MDEFHIEAGILRLVEALNRAGAQTRASCAGHRVGFPRYSLQPYVAFTAATEVAAALHEAIHAAMRARALTQYWEFDARFGTDGLLWFRLAAPFDYITAPGILRWLAWSRFERNVQADINVLVSIADVISTVPRGAPGDP